MPENKAKALYEKEVLGEAPEEIEPSEVTLRDIRNVIRSGFVDSESAFKVMLTTGDIEIGAVEIKDRDTDERAMVVGGRILVSSNVENFPDTYPLPSEQITELRNVSVNNLPDAYPLPTNQVVELRNKLRVMAWSTDHYELIEGYEGQKNYTWDSNGNLTEVRMVVIKDDSTEVTVRRTYTYDTNGNLVQVSRWEVV